MSEKIFDRYKVIDVDTHITEPPDVWTDRVASKWGNKVPHIRRVEGRDMWFIGDEPAGGPGFYTMSGHTGTFPDVPMGYDDIPAASYDAKARLELMDEESIYAMVLYPNLGGFGSGGFLRLEEPALMLECVQAYNDFQVDWSSADPNRLLPVTALPFWDVEASVKEIERSAAKGHRAVLFGSRPETFGQPPLAHKHWDPVWAATQAAGLSISFHIGSGDISDIVDDKSEMGTKANFSRGGSLALLDNQNCLANLLFGGVCARFPNLDFVSVESGVGWLQCVLEMFDWQWVNGDVAKEHPEYDLLPSEYFKRQVYGSFWFEKRGIEGALEAFPNNLMWETDYPHPTSQYPSPNSSAEHPADYAEKAFGNVPDEVIRGVVQDTPARIYGVEL
ncbi:MAG: amidohydrolase [bacterium]|nr:amidohydrolase [Deltaproteobacteria bacterium]MCP4903951.1 amidohydrolase [bacterium]